MQVVNAVEAIFPHISTLFPPIHHRVLSSMVFSYLLCKPKTASIAVADELRHKEKSLAVRFLSTPDVMGLLSICDRGMN